MPLLHFSLSQPLPADLPPQKALDAIQSYEPLITQNPFLISWRRRPVDLREIVDDDFFREDGQALAAFEIVDRIVLVPGLATKQVVIPCVMQRFENGVRCRSLAAGGVRVWSTWKVVPAEEVVQTAGQPRPSRETGSHQVPTPPATPPQFGGNCAYTLVEESRVQCNALVKPFVNRDFLTGHKEILRKVVDGISKEA